MIARGAWSGRMIASYLSRSLPARTSALCSVVEVKLVLLEHPARPALVHVAAGPRLIHADARRLHAHRAGAGAAPSASP